MRSGAAAVVLAVAGCGGHSPEPLALSRAEQNYFLHCMGCHGETGAGLEGQVPDLRKDLPRLAAMPGGRAYLLRVPGVTQSSLDPEQLAEVMNYTVRTFGGKGVTGLAPFTTAEVAAARGDPLLEVTATRANLLSSRE